MIAMSVAGMPSSGMGGGLNRPMEWGGMRGLNPIPLGPLGGMGA